jgi:predicted dehydrogenase
LPDAVVKAGAEVNQYQAERTQQRFGIPKIYSLYQEMIQKEPLDAVYICLPSFLHYEATLAALTQGLHVYCEKPMGLSSEQALALVTEAERRGLVLMPGYNYHFDARFHRARRLIQEKRIGKILQIQGTIAKPGPYIGWDPKSDWYFDQRSGGLLYDLGSHLLDLLLYLTDIEVDVKSICATARTSLPGLPMPDNIVTIFRDCNDIVASLNLAWAARANLIMIQIHGTAGSIIVSEEYFEHRTPQGGGISRLATLLGNILEILSQRWNSIIRRQPSDTTYLDASRNFIEAIRGEASLLVSARDGVRIHRVLEAIRDYLDQDSSAEEQQIASP